MSEPSFPITYQLQVASIDAHLFSVRMTIDSSNTDTLHLRLPAWIPGSYMIRDFAKNIVDLQLVPDPHQKAKIEQLDKQSWKVSSCGDKTEISYQVYAFDLSVRCAFLDHEFGFANGTSLFLQVDELAQQGCYVEVAPVVNQPNWQLYTSMQSAQLVAQGYGRYQANDYQDLIEHPLTFACADEIRFKESGIEFSMIFVGGHNADLPRIKRDLQKICAHHLKLFGTDIDIKNYLFITMLTDADYGGLEHTHSTALLFNRNELPSDTEAETMTDGYRSFLGLCSHELFHTWHVKRIKPKLLLQPDLGVEAYTEQLWIYEGFTSYYDDFSLLRSGIIDNESYLELLGQTLTRLQRTTGRFKQTVTQSSFEAWSKFYKQDENAPNAIVSYYVKGAVIALCLDLTIRQKSRQTYSLDSVMRFLWKYYGKDLRGTDDKVIQLILKDGLGLDLNEFLQNCLYTTEELPVEALLSEYGIKLHYRARAQIKDQGGKPANDTPLVDIGMVYSTDNRGATVKQISNNRAAEKAGLQKNDLIIALNDWQLGGKSLEAELSKYPLGSKLKLHYFRRGHLYKTTLEVAEAVKDTIYLTIEDNTKAQVWLGN